MRRELAEDAVCTLLLERNNVATNTTSYFAFENDSRLTPSMFQAASANPASCRIFGGPSPLFGVVDFNKRCLEAQGRALSLSGTPIYYRRCADCGFLFTDAFDDWSPEAFLKYIYNQDYAIVGRSGLRLGTAG